MSGQLEAKELLAAGVHFGHQTHKWNPKMKKYIYGEKNGIHIIDLGQTVQLGRKAYDFLKRTSSSGRPVLFVATKRQASEIVKRAAESCNSYHVTHRWLGGMLTNFKTIALSIDKIRKVEKMKENGDFTLLTKKEQSKIEKEVIKLERNLGGIKDMRKVPGAVVIIDPSNEDIAIKEARKLGIPVVAVTDTNCDPDGIDYVVPGNDDAIKSISIFADYFSQAVMDGAKNYRGDSDTGARDASLEKEILSKFEKDIDLANEEDDLKDVKEEE